jgi:uncharacterized membrane protein YiaA
MIERHTEVNKAEWKKVPFIGRILIHIICILNVIACRVLNPKGYLLGLMMMKVSPAELNRSKMSLVKSEEDSNGKDETDK